MNITLFQLNSLLSLSKLPCLQPGAPFNGGVSCDTLDALAPPGAWMAPMYAD